ncbi:class I tRNA ligase family protein [Candidatus Carsonella ruddii]|uniref:class I tRNA ligase family protein n=1 Tax=Carsonella ruddii TaxID=114186 RepID=UPI003D9A7603
MKKYFITIALPYINGTIHIGHLYESYISKMYYSVIKKYYICRIFSGLDCHGLMKNNNLLKINFFNKKKYKYFNFNINQKKTNTLINKRICNWFFILFCDKNKMFGKNTFKFFNIKKNFFIPDKYIKVLCKKCNFEMENFFCYQCNNFTQYFFISKFKKNNIKLKKINSIFIKTYIFKDWDISRHKKYNGFLIISKKNIFFYVWYDAIISYISNNIFYIKNCLYLYFLQIIGKDIIYFHKIFNILLKILNFKKTIILQHGFIIIKNKISKSFLLNFNKVKKNKLIFFFILNNKKNIKDIKYDFLSINIMYKKIFFNKILNLFFRIRKIFNLFDHKIIDFFYIKKNHYYDFNFLKTINLNNYYIKIIIDLLKLNKNINNNKFWKKKNFFLIHFYYSKNMFFYIKKINYLFKILHNKIINVKILKNYLIFDLNKFNEN